MSQDYGPAPVFLVPDADKKYDFPSPTMMPPDRGLHGKDSDDIPPGVPLIATQVFITSQKVSSYHPILWFVQGVLCTAVLVAPQSGLTAVADEGLPCALPRRGLQEPRAVL